MRPVESVPGRKNASEVPAITSVRFDPPGAEAALVNISTTGLLAESLTRLPVGSSVQVLFEGGFSPASVEGRVARCEVAAMGQDGLLRYHIAIGFDSVIALDGEAEQTPPPPVSQGVRNRW